MLSETEAVVERIRHNEVESDDEEEMEREWEKRRRTAAFARSDLEHVLSDLFVEHNFTTDMGNYPSKLLATWSYHTCQKCVKEVYRGYAIV